jgi:hypothetical protein
MVRDSFSARRTGLPDGAHPHLPVAAARPHPLNPVVPPAGHAPGQPGFRDVAVAASRTASSFSKPAPTAPPRRTASAGARWSAAAPARLVRPRRSRGSRPACREVRLPCCASDTNRIALAGPAVTAHPVPVPRRAGLRRIGAVKPRAADQFARSGRFATRPDLVRRRAAGYAPRPWGATRTSSTPSGLAASTPAGDLAGAARISAPRAGPRCGPRRRRRRGACGSGVGWWSAAG